MDEVNEVSMTNICFCNCMNSSITIIVSVTQNF